MRAFKRIAAAMLAIALSVGTAEGLTRMDHLGAVYGDNRPDGAHVELYPTHVGSSQGNIPLELGQPLYIRLSPVGFKFVGQAHDSGRVLEWNGQWVLQPRISHGVSGHIYDLNGTLHVVEPREGATSQGYRYVDSNNRIWTGDETYGSPQYRLSEFTVHGDVAIGQGWTGGAIAVTPFGRFVLEPGHTTFIRYSRQGDLHAVTISKHLENKVVMLWFTTAEFATHFPREAEPTPEPPVVPNPGPIVPNPGTPPATPECGALPLHVQNILRTFGERYPELRRGDDDQRREFTLKLAQQLAHSVSREWGTKRADPGRPPSKDAIAIQRGAQLCSWDIINGSTREVVPDAHGEDITGQVFIPVEPVNHLSVEPVPVPTPPVDPRIAELEALITTLHSELTTRNLRIEALEVELRETHERLNDAAAEIKRLQTLPEKECQVTGSPGWLTRLLGIGCRVVPKG